MNTIAMGGVAGLTTVLMLFVRRRKYNVPVSLTIGIVVIVGIFGYMGAAVASYLAFGNWFGIRFYGRILFATIGLYIVAKVFKADWIRIMNYYAPVDILALMVMKVNCLRAGCCSGIVLFGMENGRTIVFPSQIAEFMVAILILVVIFAMEKQSKYIQYQYSVYLIIYGATRFVFDVLREEKGKQISMGIMNLSVGQIFCMALVLVGIIVIHYISKSDGTVICDNKIETQVDCRTKENQ